MQFEPLWRFVTRSVKIGVPMETVTAIKLCSHTGRDCRYPDCRDAQNPAVHGVWVPAIHAGTTAYF